jgi:hypothetical protein
MCALQIATARERNDLGDLDNTEATTATDNPADIINPGKIGSGKFRFRRQFRTRAWSTMDLVKELAGVDPMARIAGRVGDYWGRQFERYTIATINGIINSNILSGGGDQVYSAGVGVGGAAPTAMINADMVIETAQTMGDEKEALSIIVLHSRLYTNLQKQNLITFIPNSQGVINIPTYH